MVAGHDGEARPPDRGSPLSVRAAALRHTLIALEQHDDEVRRIGRGIAARLRHGGTLFTAGNGGGAALAQHFSAELLGRLQAARDRPPLPARSLATDIATITAIANDYGYDMVFARQLEALCGPMDALVLFSTSGASSNLTAALRVAQDRQAYTVALVGAHESPLDRSDAVIHVRSFDPGTIQEVQLCLVHALTELIEDGLADHDAFDAAPAGLTRHLA